MGREENGNSYGYGGYVAAADVGRDSALRNYLGIIRRRIWVVLSVTAIVATLGSVREFKLSPVFQAVAKILVERQSPSMASLDGLVRNYPMWDPDYYTTQAGLLRSRAVMEKVLENPAVKRLFESGPGLGAPADARSFWKELRDTLTALLGTTPPPPPEPWERLRSQIQTSVAKDMHFLVVTVTGGDPDRAALLANAAAKAFEEFHRERQTNALGEAFAYLQREKDKAEKELRNAEDALQAFRETAGGLSPNVSEEYQPNLDRLNALNGRLTAVQLERSSLAAQIAVLGDIADVMDGGPEMDSEQLFSVPILREHEPVARLRDSLVAAEKELLLATETFGPAHPRLLGAQTNVVALRAEFGDVLRQSILSDDNRLKILDSEETSLQAQYEQEKQTALKLAREAFTFTHLQNAVNRYRKLYDSLVQRMLEVDLSSGYTKANVDVVEKAAVPRRPLNPKKARNALIYLFLGMFLGVGLAFFIENLDDAIKTPEDLKERLKEGEKVVPMLGFVPSVPLKRKPSSELDFRYKGLISLFEPMSSVTEAYRNMRTNIFYSAPADRMKVLGITSCTPREGKTTTAANLAIVIAQSGKKTLLIDGDLHRPMLHNVFALEKDVPGLTAVLIGERQWREVRQRPTFPEGPFIDPTAIGGEPAGDPAEVKYRPIDNLDVIAAGKTSPNPAELLGSDGMREMISQVRGEYDWVILDTPPVLFVSDATIVAKLCDGVMLVVRSGVNNRSVLTRAQDQLGNVKANIVGAVLNNMSVARVGRYYSPYYYHGYSRYSKDYRRTYYDRADRRHGGLRHGRRSRGSVSPTGSTTEDGTGGSSG